VSDHAQPYAPVAVLPPLPRRLGSRLHLIEALRHGLGPLIIQGTPTRVLVRPDPPVFPVMHLFPRCRWLRLRLMRATAAR
jgi:hypothetical protein